MIKKRAMTHDEASRVKLAGHKDEKEFAAAIGGELFRGDPRAKTDVVDKNGCAYSVKSGAKKWQIFLYSQKRLQEDMGFGVINGIGELLAECIDAFPPEFDEYRADKPRYKYQLRAPMRAVKDKLSKPKLLSAFFGKALFNDKVDFLAVKSGGFFHVFHKSDVLAVISKNVGVVNSQARTARQTPEQKVVFKAGSPRPTNLGEIEIRTDSKVHYREVKFWMFKNKTLTLLQDGITPKRENPASKIITYGAACEMLKDK